MPSTINTTHQTLTADLLRLVDLSFTAEDFLSAFVASHRELTQLLIDYGETHYEELQTASDPHDPELITAYVVTYQWSERAKAFSLLWRDILFQYQKAILFDQAGEIDREQLTELHRRSREVLTGAIHDFEEYATNRIAEVRNEGVESNIRRWYLQANPWPIYREQLEAIDHQCNDLLTEHKTLRGVQDRFAEIRALLLENLEENKRQFEHLEELVRTEIARLDETTEAELGRTATQLEDLENNLQPDGHNPDFPTRLEQLLQRIDSPPRISINTSEGAIQFRDLQLRDSAQVWLKSEILPQLYEVWEMVGNASNGLKMSLLNIRNRALLLKREENEGTITTEKLNGLAQPLRQFQRTTESRREMLDKLEKTVRRRLKKEFRLPRVYERPDFLSVGLQSSFNRMRIGQNKVFNRGVSWVRRQFNRIDSVRQRVQREEAMSVSEKVVRYVRSRRIDTHDNPYAAIFLTSGYIGESFWTGRERELERMADLVTQWREGFRGSVILTGPRGSGKTLFGHIIGRTFFPDHTIVVQPNSVLKFAGRKLNTSFDLGEALDFIAKYNYQNRSLVWIDDLELWSSPEIPLMHNIRKLERFVDEYSNRQFIVCATDSWAYRRFDRTQQLDKVFQAEIKLNHMDLDAMRETILLRHGATHKTLVDRQGHELTPFRFRLLTRELHQNAEGNIGTALNLWALGIHHFDEEQVRYVAPSLYPLPDLLNPDNAILLTTILLHKKTNEYRLRKQFGPAFREYGGVLQRLISVGLVERTNDGWLRIAPVAANDLARRLHRAEYLVDWN